MVNKQTKKNLKLLLEECKEKPYLFPLYPLSALGFIFAGQVKEGSALSYVMFNGNPKRKKNR